MIILTHFTLFLLLFALIILQIILTVTITLSPPSFPLLLLYLPILSYPILSFVILVVPSHFLPHIFFLATSCVLIVMRLFVSMIFTSSNSLSNSSSKHLILSDDITCIYQILSPRVYSRHMSFYEIHLIAYLIT